MIQHLTQDEHRRDIYHGERGHAYKRIRRSGSGEITGFLRVYPGGKPGEFYSVPGSSYVLEPWEVTYGDPEA